MKTLPLGLLLGLLAAFPSLAGQLCLLARHGALWAAPQPLLWAFAAGAVARPRIARRLPWRVR